MTAVVVQQLVHGYARGHELLGASLALPDRDADLAAQISDLSGMPVEERTPPYLTFYPLPSGTHYAVAGTWMDDDAPRDGCVLTRTLLVPMADWLSGLSARALAASLSKPRSPSGQPLGRPARLDPVEVEGNVVRREGTSVPSSPEFRELVIAFFGRGRRPLVWLDGPPDGDLASLLIDFVWSSLRRDITLCTYSLKPRSISGRLFDIQFAPGSAARRFSKVPERNIVGLPSRYGSKHSGRDARLASRVLGELAAMDTHGTPGGWETYARLRSGLPSDPDVPMRLVVLEELRGKAEESATAAVAVLDALAAVAPAAFEGRADKGAALEAALAQALTQAPSLAVELLGAIADRCSKRAFRLFSGQRRRIIDHVARLVALDPLACLFTVSRIKGRHVSLMAGVAAGLAAGDGDGAVYLDRLEAVRPDAVDTLIRLRPDLVALYLHVHGTLDHSGGGDFVARVIEWLRRSTNARRRTLARTIVRSPSASVSAPVLAEVIPDLGRTDRRYVLSLALDIAASNVGEARNDAFWSMLNATADKFPAAVREAVSTFGIRSSRLARLWATTYADPQLAIEDTPPANDLMPCARPFALAAILDLWGLDVLGSELVAEAPSCVSGIIRNHCTLGSPEVMRLLSAMLEAGDFVDLVFRLSPHDCEGASLDSATYDAVGARLLDSVLSAFCCGLMDEGSLRAWLRDEAVGRTVRQVSATMVIEGWKAARRRLSERDDWGLRVWQWLGGTAEALRGRRDAVTVELVEWAFEHTAESWKPEMTALWVRVVEMSREEGAGDRIGAVEAHAINTAMTHVRLPLSSLLVPSFPRLYRIAERDQPILPLFALWFSDWDKAKQLRKRLVSLFLGSDWPAGDLALAANGAGILDRVVARLRRKGHAAYLDSMMSDLRRDGGIRAFEVAREIEALRAESTPGWD